MATYQVYRVWYMRPEWFREGICYAKPDPQNLAATHIYLKALTVEDGTPNPLEFVFHAMQGEVWSPDGEARSLIMAKGLRHTSMSVGDVAIDEAGHVHLVASRGFEQLR